MRIISVSVITKAITILHDKRILCHITAKTRSSQVGIIDMLEKEILDLSMDSLACAALTSFRSGDCSEL